MIALLLLVSLAVAQPQEHEIFEEELPQLKRAGASEMLKPKNRPEYKGYPYSRANHPVIGFKDGNRDNEIFNFCGNPEGFDVGDFGKSCFLPVWLVSIAIPPGVFLVLVCFMCYSSCIYGCCRMCLGQCCYGTEGCCCAGKPRQYKKKEWLGFLITTGVLVVVIQLPFFITGLTGNAGMTVALQDATGEILDIYPDTKEVVDSLFKTMDSFNFSKITELFSAVSAGNENAPGNNDDDEQDPQTKRDFYEETSEATIILEQKLENLGLRNLKQADDSNPIASARSSLENVDKVITSVLYYVELVINIILIVREVLFDIILIFPLIGAVLLIIGAVLRVHQLAVSFFPCALVFSFIALFFIVFEYPITTFIADGCVIVYNILEGVDKSSKGFQITSFDDITTLTQNFTTGELLNEVLRVFVDCETSILGNMSGTVNSIINNLIDDVLGSFNMSAYESLLSICEEDESISGIFYPYDPHGMNICPGSPQITTKCVYDKLNELTSQENPPKTDPLLECGKNGEDRPADNKLVMFLNLFTDLIDMQFVNQKVYWVKTEDMQAYIQYLAENDPENQITEEDVNKVLENLDEYAGLIPDNVLNDLMSAIGGGEGQTKRDIPPEALAELKKIVAIQKLTLKGAAGDSPAMCADLDGKPVSGGQVFNVEEYTMIPIACEQSNLISLSCCSESLDTPELRSKCVDVTCPDYVKTVVSQLTAITSAVGVFDQIRTMINQLFDMVNKITDFVGCGTLGRIAEELPPTICEDYLKAETTFVAGMIAYSLVLWIMYIFGLVAIKRFNYANYLPVDKNDKRYYNQGEIEME